MTRKKLRKVDVKRQRDRAEMSQSFVARQLGISMSTLRAWEHGRSQPMAGYLPDMAEIFGCSIEDLFESARAEN